MKIFEIGTGYTSIPPRISAATEVVVGELANAFADRGLDIQLVDIKDPERKQRALSVREIKLPGFLGGTDVQLGIKHKVKRVVYSVFLAFSLKKEIKKSRGKIILHFHNQYNLFFFLKCTPKKIRDKVLIAYTNHSGIWSMEWPQVEETIRKRYFQEAYGMKNADAVFVLNERMQKNISEQMRIPHEKLHLIENGVNTNVFCPLKDDAAQAEKKRMGLSGKRIILQVGSVCENKGQLRVLNLLIPFLKRHPDAAYVYAGGIVQSQYHEMVKEAAEAADLADRVVYAGMLSPGRDLNRLYNAAEVTITASIFEGFPLVTLESLSAGTPVLINDIVPLPKESGCLRYTPETLPDVLEAVLYDEGKIALLGREAREYILNHFDWPHIAEQYLHVMNSALAPAKE